MVNSGFNVAAFLILLATAIAAAFAVVFVSLAFALGVNLSTVARVYRDIEQNGLLAIKRRVGSLALDGSVHERLIPASMQALDTKAAELASLAQQLPISRVELLQLVETRWKELVDVQR